MNLHERQLQSLGSQFLEESHALFPQEGSELGLRQFDSLLGDNNPGVHRAYSKLLERTLGAVEEIPERPLGADSWLDRRGLLSMLRTGLLFHRDLERWRRNPQVHCDSALQSIFGLVVRGAGNLKKALPAIESRLHKVPVFLQEGAGCVREPVPLWTKLAVKTCEGAQPFFKDLEEPLAAASADPEKTRAVIRGAAAAFTNYAGTIVRKRPGAPGSFSIGRERFEFLIRERLGLAWSAREAEATGRRLVLELEAALVQESRKFGKRTARAILDEAAESWTPQGSSLLSYYQSVTATMRERFAAAELLTLPENETCKVMLVPPFLRHQFPTAAYLQPGAFERKQEGIFWVNDLSLQQSDPEKKRAEVAQHFGLELTCAHEAYPGHHVQFVIQNRHPSKLRRLFAHAIFYEGWTLWCEKMCIDHGIYEAPHARLLQLNDALWRAHRIVIDCGLQTGTLSYDGACRMLMKGVGFTRGRAQGDVNWYTSSPTIPMSYLLGRLELEKLHAHLVTRERWPVRKFNDWILSHGAVPWEWIWQSQLRRAH